MPDDNFCLGCNRAFIGGNQLVELQIESRGVEWPTITLCSSCLTEWAEDLGFGHIADEVTA
jgi:hypothetical protein